jgi:hypothetical protein
MNVILNNVLKCSDFAYSSVSMTMEKSHLVKYEWAVAN